MVELPSALAGGSVISQIQGFSQMLKNLDIKIVSKANIIFSYFFRQLKQAAIDKFRPLIRIINSFFK
jgi:hypothetical protein